ncbi:hypothetical protein PR048_019357 [Dryococelus australis]|uniref:Uncharacterized protein n=1 Tax=Dryococelus australis TaxID=614101 RepID=A0ABQ9H398_9NEOP|nr:hypothetical protein PR048_019357 [Dryococelus australis]
MRSLCKSQHAVLRNFAEFKIHKQLTLPRQFILVVGAAVAEWLACSTPTKVNLVQSLGVSCPDFRVWESCGTMPLVGGYFRGSPISPAISFHRCSILTSITLIGSQDLALKSCPCLFTYYMQTDVTRLKWNVREIVIACNTGLVVAGHYFGKLPTDSSIANKCASVYENINAVHCNGISLRYGNSANQVQRGASADRKDDSRECEMMMDECVLCGQTRGRGARQVEAYCVRGCLEGSGMSRIGVIWTKLRRGVISRLDSTIMCILELQSFVHWLLPEQNILMGLLTLEVHPLADKFYGRLCTVHLQCRHVEVVDEEHHLLHEWRPQHSSASPVQLRLHHVLQQTPVRHVPTTTATISPTQAAISRCDSGLLRDLHVYIFHGYLARSLANSLPLLSLFPFHSFPLILARSLETQHVAQRSMNRGGIDHGL